jgi:nitroreductase
MLWASNDVIIPRGDEERRVPLPTTKRRKRMDILEIISRRVSVRDYQPKPAETAQIQEVLDAGEKAETLTHAELRYHFRSDEEMGEEVKGILGDYGKIIRAPHYIVLVARESEGYLVDAGYRFEQMILEATRRGLGTCWVAGLFKETSLRSLLRVGESWRVVALTPIGRVSDQSLVSRAIRVAARSSTRKPLGQIFFWQLHGASLPASVLANEQLMHVLEATRWAPSWKNKQPWRFILTGREVLVYKQMRQVKEGKDYHLLDCGIAMVHLHLAATATGMGGRWELGGFEVPGAPGAEPIGRYLVESRTNVFE